jgi:WD40 repeat protein/DNA-binding SARP family transcriptional activator
MLIQVNGREVSAGAPQERALLALLASSPGRVFSVAEIVSGLWGEHPPPHAAKTVQVYVSKLRRTLAATGLVGVVVTRAPGYLANVSPAAVDAERFVELAADGRRLLADGRAGQAAAVLRHGIGLWRGAAFAEFDAPFAERERTRLGELRLAAIEERVAADLALGGGSELVGELEDLVAEYPLRERLWQQLIVALYRAGRQAEALAAYQRVRSRLVEDLGIEPGEGLRDLERRVLAQDPTLGAALTDTLDADMPGPLGAVQPTLVGRDTELTWLVDAYRKIRPADVVCRVVDGPSGIGKTRLAAALATTAYADGAAVEYVRGSQSPGHRSFRRGQPTVIVYDDLHRAAPSAIEDVGALLGTASGALLVLLLVDSGEMSKAQCAAVDRLAAERITLGPLSEQSVADVVRSYVDEADLSEALSAVMAAGGAPKEIHRIAYEWAERHAQLLVDDAVVRLPDSRSVLASGRDQLSSGVRHLRHLRQERSEPLPSERIPVCPYKGLAAFDTSDAAYFFGRERLVAALVTRLVGTRVLAVVGASGAGKSSVVRAGLVPALHAGTLPGSADWTTTMLTPTQGLPPLDEPAGRKVLVIDQFEEVFTALDDRDRGEYLDRLMRLVQPDSPVTCVLTLRADYYGHCAVRPDLAELLADNTVLVGPMGADELRDAIERPAAIAGLSVDDGVSDTMLGDLVDQPGALPLLSTALLGLWEQREGRRLTLAGYLRAGGVREAISRLAESAYGRLTGSQRLVARRILLRLASGGEGLDLVRRRAAVSEVAPADDDQIRRVLNVLADRRLITLASDTVEIAHEALLREWPRLRGWLDEDEAGRRLREHLSPAARDWAARDRDPAELYRGPRLVAALEWAQQAADGLTPTEREYLQASKIAAEAEARQRRRSIRRRRALMATLPTIIALALGAGSLAVVQGNHANQATLAADVRKLRGGAAIEQRWDRALLYAAQAQRMEPSADSRMALLSTLQRSPEAIGYLHADSRILQIALNPDGSRLVTGDNHGEAIVWDTRTRRRLATLTAIPGGGVFSMDVSADGRWLVAATYTFPPGLTGDNAKLYITDLAAAQPAPRQLGIDSVVAVAFTTDPRLLLVRHQDGRLQLVDTSTGTVRKDLADANVHDDCPHPYINMSPGRHYFSTGCGQTAEAWDLSTNRPIWAGPASDEQWAVDPTATTLIRSWQNGTVDKVDLATGRVSTATQRHQGNVSSVTWAPDGRAFATTSTDNTVMLWDPRTLRPTATLRGHAGQVNTAAISPDGTRLYSAGLDSSVFIWDIDGRDRLARPVPLANPGGGPAGQFDYDIHRTNRAGTLVVSLYTRPRAPTQSGVLEVDDLTPQDGPGSYVLEGPEFSEADLDVDDAGQTAAILYRDPTSRVLTVRVLDLASRRFRPFTINLPGDMSTEAVAMSADGRTVITADVSQSLRRWDALNGAAEPGANYRMAAPASFAQRSPDGHTVAFLGPDTVELVDLVGQRQVAMITVKGADYPAFSPDGRLIAVASFTGELAVADTRTGLVRQSWLVAPGPIYSVTFTPDGRFLVSGAFDGKASFWSVDTPTTANAVIDVAHGDRIVSVVVLQNAVVTIDPKGPSLQWDINADNLLAHACAIAGRNLTDTEWKEIMPDRPYQRTCPDQT